MDMNKKTLNFIINEKDKDKEDSFKNIPIDKPLFPAIFLWDKNDSIEINKC